MQRAEGVTARVGLRAISVSSVNRYSWRLRTNGSRCYPVGAGKMQEVRADSETAVAWLSVRKGVYQWQCRQLYAAGPICYGCVFIKRDAPLGGMPVEHKRGTGMSSW
ncbi:hypothetical protein F9271_06600 [Salmonella enterica]|uniref:Uncharacterized protein n=1 Tax=Salmonella enterica TaxID=28901 RepID=A0A505CMS1_SALER|nr:hypothetical protein [Salmonella enterica]ECD9471091.1 hypothetical protein [Salmonella enterica subsp. diarizonae]EDN4535599.1 hypothetical protein [Salmonella enterica subsp. diarizonae serovar 47:k:z35]EDQ3841635.1 hypothetical protein [Salmonella enterica subsp. enterica serovar Bareilly]EBB4061332.1 hypothetical protein [Salmonella enterica]